MLTDRQKIILQILVDDYIRSAEPVGSRTISKRTDVKISPATIRNEMADLEELGYLEQPHTSAGRIPSQKGYRFYVDNLLQPSSSEDSKIDVETLRSTFIHRIDQMEQVVQQTATILSSLTNYTAIIMGPQANEAKLRHIQLLPLHDRSAVAIIVTDSGHVENRTVTIPEGIPVESIERYTEFLNRKLIGQPLHSLKRQLNSVIASELALYSEQFESVMQLCNQMLTGDDEEAKVYLGGTTMILNQPEFRNVDKLKPLLDMFGQQDELARIMRNAQSPGVLVKIGQENNHEIMQDCSLITAAYSINGKPVGTIGVLGPTRMDYARVISVLDQMTGSLSALLSNLHK